LKSRPSNSAAVTVRALALPRFLTRSSQGAQYLGRPKLSDSPPVDVIFVLAVAALYGATHWLIVAVARLGESG
jgi:hypothetical protein